MAGDASRAGECRRIRRAWLAQARDGLKDRYPQFCACVRLTRRQKWVFLTGLAVLLVAACFIPGITALAGVIAFSLLFLGVIGLRLASLMPLRSRAAPPARYLSRAQLPVYTVLVPLFGETSVIGPLVAALKALDYPPEKLDIKIVLEENDHPMRRVVAELRLPAHFHVLVVPYQPPQTKPKALNYALQSAQGALVTIFDAEDEPDPGQLRMAAQTFAGAGRSVACLQARLDFYNRGENWLTRQFSSEYAALFDLLLPRLASTGLPLPLGGTSNHFRRTILTEIGAWDPYNVTEDADIGIRLARLGYRCGVISSTTWEEANCRTMNWLRQRARWFKGWIQSWCVHMRNPVTLWRQLGPGGFLVVQILLLGAILSVLAHPIFTVLLAMRLVGGLSLPAMPDFYTAVSFGSGLVVLLTGYGAGMAVTFRVSRRSGIKRPLINALTLPAYWLLMSVAGWMAVWQFVARPFHWNKTHHGLSRWRRSG